MKRKRFTALKVTLTAMMLTAALTFGAGSAYAADLSQEGGSEPTVTITPSPEVTPELPLPTSTPKPTPVPKNGLLKEGKVYRYYVNNKPVRNKWKKINGKYYWFKSNGVAAHDGHYKIKGVFYLFNKNAQRIIPGKKSIVKVNGVKYFVDAKGRPVTGWNEFNGRMYYVHKNGKCATNETIGGIRFNKNGYEAKAMKHLILQCFMASLFLICYWFSVKNIILIGLRCPLIGLWSYGYILCYQHLLTYVPSAYQYISCYLLHYQDWFQKCALLHVGFYHQHLFYA